MVQSQKKWIRLLLFFGGNKNDGVRHHLFDWGNAKIEKKSEKQ
jgi:hypothetical protein